MDALSTTCPKRPAVELRRDLMYNRLPRCPMTGEEAPRERLSPSLFFPPIFNQQPFAALKVSPLQTIRHPLTPTPHHIHTHTCARPKPTPRLDGAASLKAPLIRQGSNQAFFFMMTIDYFAI